MPALSIRDAAKAAGVSKTSVLRAIQSGRMSAPRKDDGSGTYCIDPSELFRAFPPRSASVDHVDRSGTRDAGQTVPPSGPDGTADLLAIKQAALEAEIAGLRELVRRLDLAHADLRADRDGWRQQAEHAHRLLADHSTRPTPAPAPTPAPTPAAPQRGLLAWLRRA